MNLSINNLRQATDFLPDKIKYSILAISESDAICINEVRLKRRRPIIVSTSDKRMFLRYNGTLTQNPRESSLCVVDDEGLSDAVRRLCNYSVHAFQNELKNGFITVAGGHRVGIIGTAVINANGEITAIKNVSSLNIRIARKIKGAANEIIDNIFKDRLRSVLIVGQPSSGKTTVLRDIASRLSGEDFGFLRVCIVDERSEIAATSDGIGRNALCDGCDVLDAYPKAEGMMIALRAMSPDVIICDEIGADTDILAIQNVSNAGTILIASIHADSFSGLLKRPQFQRLMATSVFETAIVLSGRETPGKTKEFIPLKRYWR